MASRRLRKSEIEDVAKGVVLDFKELPGFENAQVSAIWPVYDKSGRGIKYYEVKFSSPEKKDNGYAIISTTTADYPVVEFSEEGLTHYEQFRYLARGKDFRMVRFGPQYITAEDSEGELVAEIGLRPAIIPKALQKHIRREIEAESGPVELEAPKVDLRKVVRRAQLLDYKTHKRKFRKPALNTAKIERQWVHALEPRGNPGCVYDYFWADGRNNRPYYSQIPPNTPPNSTPHWSGCGPTSWMNMYGWHDLNWRSSLLRGSPQYNNEYIEGLTMDLHDYLGTIWMFGQGFTMPDDMKKGDDFAREYLHHDCSRRYRQDWWWTDEDWVFEVAREIARRKRPFIVGYYQDWHYTIGYGIAECRTHGWREHSWIRIYKPDKWIPKETIFAIYGVNYFFPI